MDWLDRNYPWVMLALAVVLAPVIVGFLAASVVALLASSLGGAGVVSVLADAAMVVGVTALLVLTELALLGSFVRSVFRRASVPTSERLATLFAGLELFVPPLRDLHLSERFRPSLAERKRGLKRQYVEGELSEWAFEREMAPLLSEAEPDPTARDHPDPLDGLDGTSPPTERAEGPEAVDPARPVGRSVGQRTPDRE